MTTVMQPQGELMTHAGRSTNTRPAAATGLAGDGRTSTSTAAHLQSIDVADKYDANGKVLRHGGAENAGPENAGLEFLRSAKFQSCIFKPCSLVRHFPVLHFPSAPVSYIFTVAINSTQLIKL